MNHLVGGSLDPSRECSIFSGGGSACRGPLWSIGNIRRELKLFDRWQQQRCTVLYEASAWLCVAAGSGRVRGPDGASRRVDATRRRQGDGRVQLHHTNMAHRLSAWLVVRLRRQLHRRYVYIHRVKWRHNIYGHNTIAILWFNTLSQTAKIYCVIQIKLNQLV